MFVELSGEVFKVLKKEADGNWLISYENPSSPVFVMEKEMNRMNRSIKRTVCRQSGHPACGSGEKW